MSDYKYVKFDRTRNTLFALGTEADPETIYLTTEGKIINNGNLFGGGEQLLSDWQLTDTTAKDYIKNKPSIPSGQVQSDWAQTSISEVDYIKNKPNLATVATSGSYTDLDDKPIIPAAQVNSDWNATSGVAEILNKPTIPAELILSDWILEDTTKKDYIKNKPTIPAALIQSDWIQEDTTKADYIKNKPTIPAAQVNADWEAKEGVAEILNKPYVPSVINNTTSTSTTEALSANMGRELLLEINNLKSRGRFLSLWDCTTGLPETAPTTLPYSYNTGDYYIVSKIASTQLRYLHTIAMSGIDSSGTVNYTANFSFESDEASEHNTFQVLYLDLFAEGYYERTTLPATGTYGEQTFNGVSVDPVNPIMIFSQDGSLLGNAMSASTITDTVSPVDLDINYRPDGSQYTGAASTTEETLEVHVNDTYYYDGTSWKLLKDTGKTVTFANVAGDPYDNTELANTLNLKANQTDLTAHISDTENPHQVTAAQVGLENVDNTSDLDKPISTATLTALDEKLDLLTPGPGIKIVNNVISTNIEIIDLL